jgi:TerB-C domain
MLGLEVQAVYSMLHVAAEGPVTVRPSAGVPSGYVIPDPPKRKEAGLELDMSRVAALHAESEKVSAILGTIFTEEIVQPQPAPEPQEAETVVQDSVMGLDAEHTALVRLLCTRPEWARVELEELAQDRGILLDGTLEYINEAAFDKHDQPFSEGDDPVEINQEIVREVLQ